MREPELTQFSKRIFGHEEILTRLWSHVVSETLPPILMMSGPAGVGKRTTALHLASWILTHHRLLDRDRPAHSQDLFSFVHEPALARVQKQMLEGAHPDFRGVSIRGTDLKSIPVDAIRSVKNFSFTSTCWSRYKVVVISDIETMNRASVNALLKIAEDTPPSLRLIVTTSARDTVPATLRSRCQHETFTPLDAEAFKAWLHEHHSAHQCAQNSLTVELGQGYPGRVAAMDAGDMALYQHTVQWLHHLFRSKSLHDTRSFSGCKPADMHRQLAMVLERMVTLLRGASEGCEEEKRFFHTLQSTLPPAAWSRAWRRCLRSLKEAHTFTIDIKWAMNAVAHAFLAELWHQTPSRH